MQLITDMTEWSSKPFRPDMSLTGWLAFVGLIIVAIILWQQIIRFIIE